MLFNRFSYQYKKIRIKLVFVITKMKFIDN